VEAGEDAPVMERPEVAEAARRGSEGAHSASEPLGPPRDAPTPALSDQLAPTGLDVDTGPRRTEERVP
jgi:hypothetical protein